MSAPTRRRWVPALLAAVVGLPLLALGTLLVAVEPAGGDFAPETWRPGASPTAPSVAARAAEPLGAWLDGPEDLVALPDGDVLTGDREGVVRRIAPDGTTSVYARVGGRPLGLALTPSGDLLVANHGVGLQSVSPDGGVRTLADQADGTPIRFANELAVTDAGVVYLSDSSSRYNTTTLGPGRGSYLFPDMIDGRASGRVLAHDLATGRTWTVADGLYFPNGVALVGDRLWVAESNRYRILELDPATGATRVVTEVPGTPDNMTVDADGRVLVAVYDRVGVLDSLILPYDLGRHVVARLPGRWFVNEDDPLTGGIAVVRPDGTLEQEITGLDPAPTSVLPHGDGRLVGSLLGHPVRTLPAP